MRNMRILVGIGIVLLLGVSAWIFLPKGPRIADFTECAAAGNPVTASYPATCRTADGRTFTEDVASRKILPADNEMPAAGICAEPPATSTVSVAVNEDVPSPRCQKIHPDQRLRVKNNTAGTLSLWFGENPDRAILLQAGKEYAFAEPAGAYLASGVHVLHGTPRQGPEIWVVAGSTEGAVCAQVITKARNRTTGEVKEFPTPCNVPQGWDAVSAAGPVSGIRGMAKIGPVCPVIRQGEEDKCADKPFQTTLQVFSSPGGEAVKTVETGADGKFEAALPPGTYTISQAEPHPLLPRVSPVTVTVKPGEVEEVVVQFDSGIR